MRACEKKKKIQNYKVVFLSTNRDFQYMCGNIEYSLGMR